jgi:hypothetical protein
MQACRLRSHTVDVTPPQAAIKIMAGMAEQQTEWRNRMADDRMAEGQKEWQNGRMAGMATYVLFMVHTDTNTDTDTDTTDTNTKCHMHLQTVQLNAHVATRSIGIQ